MSMLYANLSMFFVEIEKRCKNNSPIIALGKLKRKFCVLLKEKFRIGVETNSQEFDC